MLDVCNSQEFASLPPSQIVPRLADQGRYPASESSFYRILRAADQQHRRGGASHRVMCRHQPVMPRPGPIKCGPGISPTCRHSCAVVLNLYLIEDIYSPQRGGLGSA